MAPLPPVANAIRVRVLFSIQGKQDQGLRIFIGYSGGPPTVGNLEAFGGIMEATISSSWQGLMHPDNALQGFILEDLSSDTGAVGETSFSTAGTRSGDPLSPATAFVASYEISRRYRGGHPRSYFPFGTATDLAGDAEWSSGAVSAFTSGAGTLGDTLNGQTEGSTTITNQIAIAYYSGFTAVENPITHRYRNVPTLLATPNVYSVNTVVGRSYIASVRRRRPKTS